MQQTQFVARMHEQVKTPQCRQFWQDKGMIPWTWIGNPRMMQTWSRSWQASFVECLANMSDRLFLSYQHPLPGFLLNHPPAHISVSQSWRPWSQNKTTWYTINMCVHLKFDRCLIFFAWSPFRRKCHDNISCRSSYGWNAPLCLAPFRRRWVPRQIGIGWGDAGWCILASCHSTTGLTTGLNTL